MKRCDRKIRSEVMIAFIAAVTCNAIGPMCALAQWPAPATKAAADKPLAFEVASVREDKGTSDQSNNFTLDGDGNMYWVMDQNVKSAPEGSLFRATNTPLTRYIIFAYKLNGTEELALRAKFWAGLGMDLPAWVVDAHYDIEARAPSGATKDQMRLMMQSLLAERFKLQVHWETRRVPVFAMELEKPGSLGFQLHPHPASDTCATTVYPGAGAKKSDVQKTLAYIDAIQTLPIPCGMIARLPSRGPEWHHIGGRNVTLTMLAQSLPAQTGLFTLPRPVVDETGLSGTFDFSLEWTQADTSNMAVGPNAQGDQPGPPIAKALEQQLGLKLESTKGPVELLVIDHVERLTEN